MGYIGNSHIAGDHTNNFKVLDDISSYTATFDGSATSVVDTSNNTIRVVEHRFIQGQRVTYTNGGGGNIGGLTTGTAYFIIHDSASTFKLATSASNAASSTAINLSAVGSGSSHTLNAAFDGVNTKFKLTHGSGTGARLNNATQINVAINNVLQRPNLDPNNFTDGFALEDNHKIVFQTAPTSEDIFWGSIIANTLTTFDISDHKIDTFTGDGSTTEFTLSHTPANNESLMVTINGVLQHPSNASTARAYTLIASIIQFTAAPGVGDEIQVRHIGFAGATTSDVTGFYGRTGNVVLTDQDDITVNKINVGTGVTIESNGQATFVGVVTFGSGSTTIDNNVVNVGTALTLGHTQGLQFHTQNLHSAGFEVNQINSSGIITASSLDVSGNAFIGGVLTYEDVTSIDSVGVITARDGIDCNGDLDVDGHTNLDNVSIAGVTTTTDDIIIGADNKKLKLGVGEELQLYQTGNHSIIQHHGSHYLSLRSNAFNVMDAAGSKSIFSGFLNSHSSMYYNGSYKIRTQNTGAEIVGTVVATGADINGDIDVDGHTNLDNVSVAGISTFSDDVKILDNKKLIVGSSDGDLTLKHFSGSYYSQIAAAPPLYIQSNDLQFRDYTHGDYYIRAVRDGSVDLYHNNAEKLSTTASGVEVTGITTSNNGFMFGTDGEMYLYKGAANTATLRVTSNGPYVEFKDASGDIQMGSASGTLRLSAGGNEKVSIDASGYVNIGMTGESTPLAVKGISGALSVTSRANISLFTGATDGASATGTGILFFNHSGGGQFFGGSLQVIKENSGNGNTDSLMRFATRANGGAVTERMRITSGGTLGINLLSPDTSFRLDCSGTAQFTTSTTNQQNDFLPGQLTVRNNQSAQGAFIDFRADSATGIQGVIAKIGGFNVHSGSGYDGNLFFSTRQNSNNTMVERLRIKNDGIVCLDSAAGAIVIGDNSINANYSSARLYIRSGTNTQTSANTDMIQLSLYDRNSQRNGAEGSGSWKSKIQFLAAQINGGAREGAFIQQDIKYNNFSGGSTKMRADLVFATRGDAQSSSSDGAVEQLRITHNGHVLINGSTFYGTGNNSLQVHDSTLVLSKVGSGTRNWRFVNNNLVAGNLGLQVSNADNGSTTYVDRIEIDKDGKVCIGNPATDPIANLEVHAANPILYVRDSAGTSADNDAKIGFGNASHYPTAYLSHIWDGTSGSLTAHTRSGGNEYLALQIDAAQRLRTRGATNIGHGGMVYIQGYSDPTADETKSNLTVRGEGGNGFCCGTYEATGNYASWIQAGYVQNFTGGSPAAIYPLVLQPNGAPVCIGNISDASTDDGGLLRIQTRDGSTKVWHDYGLTLEHIDGSNARGQKFAFINANNQGTPAESNSIFRQHATPYMSSTTYQVWTDRIVYQHRPLYNQYSWYKFNVHVTSSSRGGSARMGITWSSRHAGPGGYGEYSFAWTDEHHTSRAQVFLRKQHFLSIGGASHGPYNWTSNPAVTVYSSTGGGSAGGFYLRVEGHLDANGSTYDGGVMHHFDIVHNDNNTGGNNTYFEFVQYGSSGPSEANAVLSFN